MIPYSKQSINKKDILSVIKVLKSNYLTKGPKVNLFENKVKKVVKARYAVASNSGSSGLHLACLALGVGKDDIVWTVPNTYAASANCAINCGAKVDFVDICPETFNISVDELENKLIKAKKFKKLPKVLIPVHLGGQPYEQKKIWELSKKYRFKIIEDASHAFGAKHYGEIVGSCRWSDITVFSFHPVKIITTAEGGISMTNNKSYYEKMRSFRENGIIFDKKKFKKKNNYLGYYEQISSGYNYRMNDISAAIGISQIERFRKFIKKRNVIANYYKRYFKNTPIKIQKVEKYNFSSFHLFIIQFNLKKTRLSYKDIFKKYRDSNIYVNLHYKPLHLNPFFRKLNFKKKQFPISENYGEISLSIPIFYEMKNKDINKVIKITKSFFN